MSAAAFRTKRVQISARNFQVLKAAAEVQGLDCPDALADLWLAERIAASSDLDWLSSEYSKRMKQLDADFRARIGAEP